MKRKGKGKGRRRGRKKVEKGKKETGGRDAEESKR